MFVSDQFSSLFIAHLTPSFPIIQAQLRKAHYMAQLDSTLVARLSHHHPSPTHPTR